MYKRMMIAYDESPEAKHALERGLELANLLGAQIKLVTVSEPLPAYVAYAEAVFPGSERVLAQERENFYMNLQERAKEQALVSGVEAEGIIIEGAEVGDDCGVRRDVARGSSRDWEETSSVANRASVGRHAA